MPAKPQYVHDLIASVKLLNEQVANLRQETDDLGKTTEALRQANADLRREVLTELTVKSDGLKDMLAEVRREAAVLKQQVGEQSKRAEEWDRRGWGLMVLLIGAVLSLAAGLIVALAKRP